VPEGFATFFGALGLLCVLLAFIAPLRRVLRPVVRFLDLLIVPSAPTSPTPSSSSCSPPRPPPARRSPGGWSSSTSACWS
jgi:hypothetical protein